MRYLGIDYSDQEAIDCGDVVVVRGTARIRLLRESGERPDFHVLFLDIGRPARRPLAVRGLAGDTRPLGIVSSEIPDWRLFAARFSNALTISSRRPSTVRQQRWARRNRRSRAGQFLDRAP